MLALDACGAAPSAAAVRDGSVVAVEAGATGPGAAESLPALAAAVAAAAGARLAEVDLVAVTTGPGGFTGMRVGVATARALALATGAPVLALGVAEVLAAAVRQGPCGPRAVTVVLGGGRGEVVVQHFAAAGPAQAAPSLLTQEQAARLLEGEETAIAAVAGIRLGQAAEARRLPPPAEPMAALLARAAIEATARGVHGQPGAAISPWYHRPPDARPDAGRALLAEARA